MSTRAWFLPAIPQLGLRSPWNSNIKASVTEYPLASKIMIKNLSVEKSIELIQNQYLRKLDEMEKLVSVVESQPGIYASKNLSYSTTESLLKKEFSNFGQIAEVKLVMDEKAKRPKGYAFIQYTCQDDAMLALESMDYEYFDGRLIYVELAKPERNSNTYPITSGPPQQQNPVEDSYE